MSHYKLLDKLGIEIGETKTRVNLYHRYKDNDYDTITDWWVKADDVEDKLRLVISDEGLPKNRKYIARLEKENRELKNKLSNILNAIKGFK